MKGDSMSITEEKRIIRDGERIRVPLMLMDELQRSVQASRLHDGMGNAAGFKPGFVFMTGLDEVPRREAHDRYQRLLGDGWKNDSADLQQEALPTATQADA